MKSFYSFYRKLKEYLSVGTEKDFSESINEFLKIYKDQKITHEDRLLPMLVAADVMDEFFGNHPKADLIRKHASEQDYYSLVMASENYKKHGFFTFNENYTSYIQPMIVVVSNNYPLDSIIDDGTSTNSVKIHAIAPVTNEKKQEAIKLQMSIDFYFKNKIQDFEPTSAFVNMDSADLEFFPVSKSNVLGQLSNIVTPNGNLKLGKFSDIHERIKPEWLDKDFPEIFGENLTRGNFFVLNDLENNND